MNKIAELGKLLIEYQDYVETGLILLAAVIVLALIVKAFNKSKRREKLLDDINDTVTDINTKVDKINSKSSEVIYIDNRTHKSDTEPGIPEIKIPPVQDEQKEENAGDDQTAAETATETEMNGTAEESEKEPEIEVPKKFTSRECAVSRQGREYTLEELIKQIKE